MRRLLSITAVCLALMCLGTTGGSPMAAGSCQTAVDGDPNGDGRVDVADVNLLCNVILEFDTLTDSASFAAADVVADGNIDVDDVNALISLILAQKPPTPPDSTVDTLPHMGWLIEPPAHILEQMMLDGSRNRTYLANGRLLVWNVTPGDSLRLTIEHDNSIPVWMRSYAFYPSADTATWTQANALAYGANIKTIAGRDSSHLTVPEGAQVLVCSGYWNDKGRIGDGATAASTPYTAFQLERWADTTGIAPRTQLRVLAVGNSFTCDELSYLPYVIQSMAPEVDLHLRLLKRPNADLSSWVEHPDSMCLDGNDNLYYDWQPFPGRWTTPVVGTLREQVTADAWDLVVVHQASSLPYWRRTLRPLQAMTTWLRDSMDYNGRIGWLMTHAYSDSNVMESLYFPELNTSDEMWALNQELADSVMHSGLVDLLLPTGTAVQNARHTRLDNFTLNHLCAGRWDRGQRGDIHLQEGIGPFVAACAAAGALLELSPINARVELSSSWRIPNANPSFSNVANNPTLEAIENYLGGLGMDPDSQALGAWCAEQAWQHPFELIQEEP